MARSTTDSTEITRQSVASWQAMLPLDISKLLTRRAAPDADGAIGRNRNSYVHARFQYGLHAHADLAINLGGDEGRKALALFFRCLRYGLRQQTDAGDFRVSVPFTHSRASALRSVDLASASSFFFASAGAGCWALMASRERFSRRTQAELDAALAESQRGMRLGLGYLIAQHQTLMVADARAPNRLLINALALHSLAGLLDDAPARQASEAAARAALDMQHPDGYFLEGSGYDTSYNAVAMAVGLRLLLSGAKLPRLQSALQRALQWQVGHVANSGEISTAGNSRVFKGGETFMGVEKQMDAAHAVEAFALAGVVEKQPAHWRMARRIAAHYGTKRS